MEFETVIGLEVHAQLLTKSKLFCACPTNCGSPPNQNTCPVCLGLPGALPVANRHAVDLAIVAGLALDCTIQEKSVWERKNYFYQDLPKGYQITQYAQPLCINGHLTISVNDGQEKKIGITRIHMEEDAGKSLHDTHDDNYSRVDLNRAGVPLVEIVSEPDLRTPEEAGAYLRSLRAILQYAEVCDGNMDQGSLRCDANISIRPQGQKEFGTKVELKNLNSIRFIEKALAFEIERQKAILNDGGKIIQETRLYDSQKNKTAPMRSKEQAHDYRYFPDPDLVPLLVHEGWIQKQKKGLPELPKQKAARFVQEYQIPDYDANVLTSEKALADYFEKVVRTHNNPKKISNWIMTELLRELKNDDREIQDCPVPPENMGELVSLIDEGTISGKIAKTVFEEMYKTSKDPKTIVQEKNLLQVSDTSAIEKVIDDVIANHPTQYGQYKSGKDKLFSFFVGQVMKAMKGQGNPQVVNDLLKKKL